MGDEPGFALRDGWRVTDDGSMAVLHANSLPVSSPRPGDLVFITDGTAAVTHGGLFVRWTDEVGGVFEFVNASSYTDFMRVVVDSWPVNGKKRRQRFVGFGRLILVR